MELTQYFIPANEWEPAAALPEAWGKWREGWQFFKRLDLKNTTPLARENEPIEVEVEFHAGQVSDLAREVRVAEVATPNGPIREVPSQVYGVVAEDAARCCRLFFIAGLKPAEMKTYLIFYGNPAALEPSYETDLKVSGEEYALDVENRFYRIELAKSMGHLKSLAFKEGSAAFVGSGPPVRGGHGVEGTVHHNPDWNGEYTGRYRMTNWESPPHYEVIRGPVCVRIKRWGHPVLALGPGVGREERVMATVTYTFYASVPYIVMESRLDVLEDVRFRDCRNDEWVGIGEFMPDMAWRVGDGEIGFGQMSWHGQDPAWLTVYNKQTGDGFASIRLDYECTHPSWREPSDVVINDHWGGLWVRYPLRNAMMRAGDFVHEKNAYLLHKYAPSGDNSFGMLTDYAARLSNALVQEAAPVNVRPLTVPNIWDALGSCHDSEVYIGGTPWAKRMLSFVDLGWVRNVEIDGDAVRIAMVLPYEGRRTSFDWFAERMEQHIRERVAGVGDVEVELVREPAWDPEQMTLKARRIMGLKAENR